MELKIGGIYTYEEMHTKACMIAIVVSDKWYDKFPKEQMDEYYDKETKLTRKQINVFLYTGYLSTRENFRKVKDTHYFEQGYLGMIDNELEEVLEAMLDRYVHWLKQQSILKKVVKSSRTHH